MSRKCQDNMKKDSTEWVLSFSKEEIKLNATLRNAKRDRVGICIVANDLGIVNEKTQKGRHFLRCLPKIGVYVKAQNAMATIY